MLGFRYMKACLVFVLVLFVGKLVFAQTGPGGVGNSTSNVLWLESDSIPSLSDGDDITTWTDGSGNANDVTQPNASFKPIYKTGIVNGFPVVRFNRTNGRIRKTGFTNFPTTSVTEFFVNTNGESNDATLSYATTVHNNDFLLFSSNSLNVYRGGNTNSGIAFNDNTWHICGASWQSSNGGTQVWKDGTQSFTTTGHQTGTSITTGGCFAIAGEQDGVDAGYDANQAHFGDFSEVIVYNTFLNTAQHIIVANYLGAKFNLTIANDYFAYEGTHSNDVAGIGREDATNTHTTAMSAGILQVQNPTGLNINQEYLLFGHDDADATTAWTTTEAPDAGVNIQRLGREWRFDETNEVGNVEFLIDVADMPALPVGHTMYAVMIDADGDFSSGASVYELDLVAGTEYSSLGIDINSGDFVAIAAVNPTVEHTITTSTDFEPNNASIAVSLNFIAKTAKTVDFTTADGTALSAQPDYTAVAGGTVTIPVSSSTANYAVTITNDVVVESSETLTITLSNPSAGIGLGTNTIHTYTILDDDDLRKVTFAVASASGNENVSPVSVGVTINLVDATNPTTVDYTVTGGTAVGGGTDYTLAAGTVTIVAGLTAGSFSFTVNDELLYELDETIIITLSNPSNCNLDGTGFIEYTYTINANDIAPVMQFTSTSSSGSEPTSPVNFQVELDAVSGVDAIGTYTITGTASGAGSDYTLANGTVTIPIGSLTANITALITDDAIEELSETMIITLTVFSDVTIGGNSVYTYTIIDDDVFGHLGPGGVGKSSNNVLWTKAHDMPVVADGTDVTAWADSSGNTNDLSQGNTSFTPRYYANILNGNPVVRFEQANNRLIHNSFANFPTSSITTILVNRNSDSGDGVVSYASTSHDNDYLWYNSNSVAIYRGAVNTGTGTAINGNTWRILQNTWQGSDGNTRFYRNGTQNYTGTLASGTSITQGGNFALAGEQDGVNSGYSAGQSSQGDYAEVILYNVVLNSAQRKIVNNYLSAKYGIAIANDMFSYDALGTFETEVAGIGRDDASNFHIDAQGTAIVRVNTPSSLSDGDYLIWGHDNASTVTPNTTDKPAAVDNRLERIWRLEETNDVGTVSVHFDLSGFTIASSGNLVLLIDSDDGLFANAVQIPISSFAANIATFDNVNFSSGNWFTIGSLSSENPLPIELVEFKAEVNEDKVDLSWTTMSESNNDFFTVEKSKDGIEFEKVLQVSGKGNNNSIQNYLDVDRSPFDGLSYYRLKQTDFNGNFSYSSIVPVNFKSLGIYEINVYPNPWSQESSLSLKLRGFNSREVYVELQDVTGRKYYSKLFIIENDNVVKSIRLKRVLPPGAYFISASSDKEYHYKKIIVK